MKDLLKINKINEIKVLDKGIVRLIDVMPRLSEDNGGDFAIVQGARVSYGKGTKTVNKDKGLIRYLMRHQHWSPFELVSVKFHLKMPIFVMRQHVRHRSSKMNEYSGRYSVMSNEFYVPEPDRIQTQSKTNKQGTDEDGDLSKSTQIMMSDKFEKLQNKLYEEYKYMIDDVNISREMSRINLPLSNYTECYWKIDLRNLFNYIKLRMDSHAQYEIRVYAKAMYDLCKPIFPHSFEAFDDYILNGDNISSMEKELLCNLIKDASLEDLAKNYNMSGREIKEFKNKFRNTK